MAQWEKLATATSSIESLLLLNANCLTPNLLVQPAPTFRKYAPESSLVEYFFIPKQNAKKISQHAARRTDYALRTGQLM